MLPLSKLLDLARRLFHILRKTNVLVVIGRNQQRQAVPLINPNSPIVGTGMEETAARNTGQIILAEGTGQVIKSTGDEVTVDYGKTKKTYNPMHFVRSNEGSVLTKR